MLRGTGSGLHLRAIVAAGGVVLAKAVAAQVVFDGSLGAAGALAGPAYAIAAASGKQVGGNLFHSFSRFDIAKGESATFSGPASVANVIGRVTGGSASTIDGAVRSTIAGANLYLINPKGIVFGANASLDVDGSFHASTADYLKFGDGARFSASEPAQSTLTSAAPAAFGFLAAHPAGIRVEGAGLAGASGRGLSLTAGAVDIVEASIAAPGGRLAVAAVGGPAEIALGADAGLSASDARGTIGVTDSLLETDGSGTQTAGSIQIRGGKLMLVRSTLSARHAGGEAGGDIRIAMSDSVSLHEGSAVYTRTGGQGAAGGISVEAPAVALDGESYVKSASVADGAGGAIVVKAGRLSVGGRAYIETAAHSQGKGGGIEIAASERIDISGERSHIASVGLGAGEAGAIGLTAPTLEVAEGAALSSDVRGSGKGGGIAVKVSSLTLRDDGIVSVLAEGAGAGGSVDIAAERVDIAGGKRLATPDADPVTGLTYVGYYSGIYATSQTATSGNAGQVRIRADALRISDGGMISGITLGNGKAGDFTIDAGTIDLTGGGLIHTSTSGAGAAGSIVVNASGMVTASGRLDSVKYAGFAPRSALVSGIVSKATPELNPTAPSLGNGGAIVVDAARIALADGAEISTSAAKNAAGGTVKLTAQAIELSGSTLSSASGGSGNAGDVSIVARDALRLRDGSAITTEARSADGGNIDIRAQSRVELRQSRIATAVSKDKGNGGNIFVDPQFVVLDASRVVATAWAGHGGNIRIEAQNFVASPDSVVDASSQKGVSGTVQITTPNSDVGSGLAAVPTGFFDAASLLRSTCAARAQAAGSSLVVAGRGGLPESPEDFLLARSGTAPPLLAGQGGNTWNRRPCAG